MAETGVRPGRSRQAGRDIDDLRVVSMFGRLGNQLFQFAMLRALEPPDRTVVLEPLYISDAPLREALKPGSYRRLTPSEGVRLWRPPHMGTVERARRLMAGALRRVPSPLEKRTMGRCRYAEREQGRFDPGVASVATPVVYEGFFQHEDYFRSSADLIVGDLRPPSGEAATRLATIQRTLQGKDIVALGLRAGLDYVGAGWTHPFEWYRRAAEMMASELDAPAFLVFSDIPLTAEATAAALHDLGPSVAVIGLAPADQLQLAAEADHAITPASSFGWWQAWLGDQRRGFPDSRIVICPRPWIWEGSETPPPRWRTLDAAQDPVVSGADPPGQSHPDGSLGTPSGVGKGDG